MNSETCGKIIYLCPSAPKGSCHWEGDASDILEHFQDAHKDLLMDSNTIKADVTQDSEHNRLMALEKGLLLVQTKVSVKAAKLWISLRFLGSSKELAKIGYCVEIISGKFAFTNGNSSDEYNPVFNTQSGVEVDIQAINLMAGVRNIDWLLVTVIISGTQTSNEIAKSAINSTVQEKRQNINFVDSNNKDSVEIERETFTPDDSLEKDYLQELKSCNKWKLKDIAESCEDEFYDCDTTIECTNCHRNMIPPIYMCPDGHSVCCGCRYQNCSTCEQTITELRNIDLEEYSKTLEYSCRYEAQGCTDKFQYDQIRRHEIYCDHCTYKCELCAFEGRINEIPGHFRIAHPSTKIYETMEEIHFPRGSNIIVINDKCGVFYCTSRATETYIEWTVVFCGPKERCFSCEIRVTGKKQQYFPKRYFLQRTGNVFRWSVPWDQLKSANVKEKYATLCISSY